MTDHLTYADAIAELITKPSVDRKDDHLWAIANVGLAKTHALIALTEQATRIADALEGSRDAVGLPLWIPPLTEDEERRSVAESGPVGPCEPRSPQTGADAPPGENGAQGGAEPGYGDWVDEDDDLWRHDDKGWRWWVGSPVGWSSPRARAHDPRMYPVGYIPFRLATDADYQRTGASKPQADETHPPDCSTPGDAQGRVHFRTLTQREAVDEMLDALDRLGMTPKDAAEARHLRDLNHDEIVQFERFGNMRWLASGEQPARLTLGEQIAAELGAPVILCPSCGHGISPHGFDPGGPCGVSGCPCLLSPNGVAHLLTVAREDNTDD